MASYKLIKELKEELAKTYKEKKKLPLMPRDSTTLWQEEMIKKYNIIIKED